MKISMKGEVTPTSKEIEVSVGPTGEGSCTLHASNNGYLALLTLGKGLRLVGGVRGSEFLLVDGRLRVFDVDGVELVRSK